MGGTSRPVSRILFPGASRPPDRRPSIWARRHRRARAVYPQTRTGRPRTPAQAPRGTLLTLLRVGFTEPPRSPGVLVVSYTTVSPLPPARAGGGLFSVALSRGSPRVAVSEPPCPAESGLSSTGSPPPRPPGLLVRGGRVPPAPAERAPRVPPTSPTSRSPSGTGDRVRHRVVRFPTLQVTESNSRARSVSGSALSSSCRARTALDPLEVGTRARPALVCHRRGDSSHRQMCATSSTSRACPCGPGSTNTRNGRRARVPTPKVV